MKIPESILISRTDSVGDIILALPVAGFIKKHFPGVKVAMLASSYTQPVVNSCEHIDAFVDVEDFFTRPVFIDGKMPAAILHLKTNPKVAKRASELGIPLRVGTMSRLYHWLYCNQLVWLSRKNTGLHEAQYNFKLLKPFGVKQTVPLSAIPPLYGLTHIEPLAPEWSSLFSTNKLNVILHPKSRGNAREWPAAQFISLINMLPPQQYQVFLTGVQSEADYVQQIAAAATNPVVNMVGKIPLIQFVSFIDGADGLVANSTGPVHIAAALGKNTIGLYPSLARKNIERWGPIGVHAQAIAYKEACSECKDTPNQCRCMNSIQPIQVKALLDRIWTQKQK